MTRLSLSTLHSTPTPTTKETNLPTPSEPMTECLLCEKPVNSRQATVHIGGCLRKTTGAKILLRASGLSQGIRPDTACHIKVYGPDILGPYTAHFLVRPDRPLYELDQAIRVLWMEPCCEQQHLSRFTGGYTDYLSIQLEPEVKTMDVCIQEAWRKTRRGLRYVFDIKTSTECYINDHALYKAPWEDGVKLLAISQEPDIRCDMYPHPRQKFCRQQATVACMTKAPKTKVITTYYACDDCAAKTRLPWRLLNNSPRSGACQYGTTFPHRKRTSLRERFMAKA